MKQLIEIGAVIDDGTGDYLRKGGEKTNANFDEIYSKLGDGQTPFPAGAWRTVDSDTAASFGDALAIDTTGGQRAIRLPKGTSRDYNKSIRLRDVWKTWKTNPVTVHPADGDTIKGSPAASLDREYMDVEMVYCHPATWVYLENKRLDKITSADISTVAKKEFIATEGQVDFREIFTPNNYNPQSVEVYLRGNLLYYGPELNENSNYGSIGPDNSIVALDGRTIRLKIPCTEGDPVTFVSYFDGVSPWRSTYTRKQIKMYDTKDTVLTTEVGKRVVADLKTKLRLTKEDFRVSKAERINPNSLEVLVNGVELIRSETADYPAFICEGVEPYDQVTTREQCVSMGGEWVLSNNDYEVVYDDEDEVIAIDFGVPFETNDVITLKWFNNEASTIMDWDGDDSIKEHTDKIYLNNEQVVTRQHRIEYTDYNNPSQQNMILNPQITTDRIFNVSDMFDVIYPIGTLYSNAHNPNNPRDYMGFGTWVRYKEALGRAIVGWDSRPEGSTFAYNNNDIDEEGNPRRTAGGTTGRETYILDDINIPELSTDKDILVADPDGTVIIGGCYVDPDAEGPGYKRYTEAKANIRKDQVAESFNIIQPSVTAHVWLRVA